MLPSAGGAEDEGGGGRDGGGVGVLQPVSRAGCWGGGDIQNLFPALKTFIQSTY